VREQGKGNGMKTFQNSLNPYFSGVKNRRASEKKRRKEENKKKKTEDLPRGKALGKRIQ